MGERQGEWKILCVDDEPNVLAGLRRTLFDRFDVHTAEGGEAGLRALADRGPFAVVVSDMRMPGMDGAQFLERAYEAHPETVRILLTGFADMTAAIAAVNRGHIFRFLSKPCPEEELLAALAEAVEIYRLRRVEQDLLEQTVAGAVKVLAEVLGLAAPAAFARAGAVRALVAHMAARLGVEDPWQVEVAARLSQLGCITLAPETLERVFAGQALDPSDAEAYARHPEVGARLLGHIPRLEAVAAMVAGQSDPARVADPAARRGAAMLRLAIEVDRRIAAGEAVAEAVAAARRSGAHPAELCDALAGFEIAGGETVVRALPLGALRACMVTEDDIRTTAGQVLVARGIELNAALIERLRNFARRKGVIEPIRVRVPAAWAGGAAEPAADWAA